MKVIIAGAGLAGMTAAWRLANEGHEVTVLEASDRVGGRSWSQRLSNGEMIERGGEFIFPSDHAIRMICAELELPLISHEVVFNRRFMPDGSRMSVEELDHYTLTLKDTITAMVRDGQDPSLDAAAREAYGADYVPTRLHVRLTRSYGVDPKEISARAILHRMGEHNDFVEHLCRILNGNNSVTQEIHRRLGRDTVRFGRVVTAVEQRAGKVVFTTSDGEAFAGDAAVVAIPLPMLKRLMEGFALPELVRAAIDTSRMGAAAKISGALRSESTPRAVQSLDGLWWTWNSASPYGGQVGRLAVTGYAGSQHSVDRLGLQDGGKSWWNKVRASRSDLDLCDEYVVTDWQSQPYTLGLCAGPGLGWRPELERAFDNAVGRIAFAGEHTRMSTLNGATYSGMRAAKIVRQLA